MPRQETRRERRAFIIILLTIILLPICWVGLWLLVFFTSCEAGARLTIGMTRTRVRQELRGFRETDVSYAAAPQGRIWSPDEKRVPKLRIRKYHYLGLSFISKPIYVGYDDKGKLAAIQEYD